MGIESVPTAKGDDQKKTKDAMAELDSITKQLGIKDKSSESPQPISVEKEKNPVDAEYNFVVGLVDKFAVLTSEIDELENHPPESLMNFQKHKDKIRGLRDQRLELRERIYKARERLGEVIKKLPEDEQFNWRAEIDQYMTSRGLSKTRSY